MTNEELFSRYKLDNQYIDVLKQLMEDNDLSQQKFADKIGVNQTTVGKWLSGKKKPSLDNIVAVCRAFEITPNQFFGMD